VSAQLIEKRNVAWVDAGNPRLETAMNCRGFRTLTHATLQPSRPKNQPLNAKPSQFILQFHHITNNGEALVL
jgi:hypothetical protein